MGVGDRRWWIGDWALGIAPNPQPQIPNPQSPIPNPQSKKINKKYSVYNNKYIPGISITDYLYRIVRYTEISSSSNISFDLY